MFQAAADDPDELDYFVVARKLCRRQDFIAYQPHTCASPHLILNHHVPTTSKLRYQEIRAATFAEPIEKPRYNSYHTFQTVFQLTTYNSTTTRYQTKKVGYSCS